MDPRSAFDDNEAAILRAFSDANAMSSFNAKTPHELGIAPGTALTTLLERGFVRQVGRNPDTFYAPMLSRDFLNSPDQRKVKITAGVTLAAIAGLALLGIVLRMVLR
jgi:hypothetical protein